MNRMLIFDRDQNGFVLHVRCVWEILLAVRPDLISNAWKVRSSYGTREDVCVLDELVQQDRAVLTGTELSKILNGHGVFYDGVFEGDPIRVLFGVRDSTYLFVESEDVRIKDAIRRSFHDVR